MLLSIYDWVILTVLLTNTRLPLLLVQLATIMRVSATLEKEL